MKTIRLLLIHVVLVAVTNCDLVFASDGPLQIFLPKNGWKIHYTGTNGIDFYSVTPQKEGSGILMFSKWPPPTKPEDIPVTVRKLADGFVKQAKKSTAFALISEKYDLEQIAGDHCKGTYATFHIKAAEDENVQTMFMISIDGQFWNGQFTGTKDDWTDALKLLNTISIK